MINQIEYYAQKILKTMASIENKTKKLFHEIYPDLEGKFWQAREDDDLKGLRQISFKLDKIIDEINRG